MNANRSFDADKHQHCSRDVDPNAWIATQFDRVEVELER
jgi:hypothetical protein